MRGAFSKVADIQGQLGYASLAITSGSSIQSVAPEDRVRIIRAAG
jgi:hypothetical protein